MGGREAKADPPPKLDTIEEIELSIRRSDALSAEAECQLRQQAVERNRFELSRSRVLLWLRIGFLSLAMIVCAAGAAELLQHPEQIPVSLLVAGSGGGLLSTRIRSGQDKGAEDSD